MTPTDLEAVRFRLEQVAIRMRFRVESGKENVAIGQIFAQEIVSACESATALLQRFPGLGSGWTPIAEAPRDGTHVLLARKPNVNGWRKLLVAEGYWSQRIRFWRINGATIHDDHFSHFMHLLSPPAGEK